ncbi:MAG: rhodanese-like domain-containing protein [Sedimentibacter sp.]
MKKIFSLISLILVSSFIIVGCTTSQPAPAEKTTYMDITVADAKDLITSTPELVIIDVSPAYASGHLPNAINYPLGDGSLDNAISMLDMNKTYLVYCHTDAASMEGAQKLIDAGFMNVYRLEDNYAAWVDAGNDIEGVYMDISVMAAKDLIASTPELVIIDVSPAYANGHLPNAINYPLGDGSLDNAISMLDMNKTYLVYCHTDAASMEGAQKLVDAGFKMVYRLEGNYAAWVDAGNDIEGVYMDISVMDAKDLIAATPEIIIIDVSPAYADGHLPNAVNYYIGDGSLDNAIPMLDMSKTYLVYCHTDAASMEGAQKLVDAGFKMVYRLEGNYAAWIDAGLMVEK